MPAGAALLEPPSMAPYDQLSVVEGITDQTKFPQPGTGKERFVQTGYDSYDNFFSVFLKVGNVGILW